MCNGWAKLTLQASVSPFMISKSTPAFTGRLCSLCLCHHDAVSWPHCPWLSLLDSLASQGPQPERDSEALRLRVTGSSFSGLGVWRGLRLAGRKQTGSNGDRGEASGGWGSRLEGWPAAPRNLSAMQPRHGLYLFMLRVYLYQPLSHYYYRKRLELLHTWRPRGLAQPRHTGPLAVSP